MDVWRFKNLQQKKLHFKKKAWLRVSWIQRTAAEETLPTESQHSCHINPLMDI